MEKTQKNASSCGKLPGKFFWKKRQKQKTWKKHKRMLPAVENYLGNFFGKKGKNKKHGKNTKECFQLWKTTWAIFLEKKAKTKNMEKTQKNASSCGKLPGQFFG